MIFKNDNIGLLCGTFIGAIIGSVGTIFVFNKIRKKDEEKFIKHEEEVVEELKEYYSEKLNTLKENYYNNISHTENVENVEKVVKEEVKVDKKPVVTTNKQTRITFNNVEVKEDRKNGEVAAQFDYSKISKADYTDLQKEYEREEIKEEYDEHPHQITKANYDFDKGFNKMELIYYEQNGLFTYMDDEICNTVTEEVIGFDNLSLFGTDDASIDGMSGMYDLYLRSSKIMTDFHLIYNGTEDYYKVIDPK